MTISVFTLCLVKLEQYAVNHDMDFDFFGKLLSLCCTLDYDTNIIGLNDECLNHVNAIRNSKPFIDLDLKDEIYVYDVFSKMCVK